MAHQYTHSYRMKDPDTCLFCEKPIAEREGNYCVCSMYSALWGDLTRDQKEDCHTEMRAFFRKESERMGAEEAIQ